MHTKKKGFTEDYFEQTSAAKKFILWLHMKMHCAIYYGYKLPTKQSVYYHIQRNSAAYVKIDVGTMCYLFTYFTIFFSTKALRIEGLVVENQNPEIA